MPKQTRKYRGNDKFAGRIGRLRKRKIMERDNGRIELSERFCEENLPDEGLPEKGLSGLLASQDYDKNATEAVTDENKKYHNIFYSTLRYLKRFIENLH